MKIYFHYYFILSFLFTTPIFSQTTGKNTDSIISFQTMHVHFDKDIYLPGETIWFKAYLYNVSEISVAATNFYVAIYNEKGKLLQQKQYPILEGSCNGDFEIPDTIQSTRIQFRAFTKAMIIDDSNNVYEKKLTVYNKENSSDSIAINKIKNLQFFPEGGQMIAELENHIAFKASYSDGSPAIINGQIIEVEKNKKVDAFFTDSMGLGKLVLYPTPHKNYMAVWKDDNGNIMQTPLPVNNRYGVSFHTEIINRELEYSIIKNKKKDSLNNLHLLAQMGNYQVYKADLEIPNEMVIYTAKFSIAEVPAGLMQLNLFDKYWNLLQQRLVFISDSSFKDQLLVNADTINTNPKGQNSIEITLPDTMFTNLSVSIADVNFNNKTAIHSITRDLYFNTQLKELNQNTDSLLQTGNNKNIDLVTLTHPWKKYNWQKLVNKAELQPEVLDNYISLTVNYKEKNLALPKDDALNLIINTKGMGKQFYSLKPASQTAFKKTNLLFFDSVKVAYQMDKNKELANYLKISRDDTLEIPQTITPLQSTINFITAKKNIETFTENTTKNFNGVKTIKEVVVKTKYKGNPILERIDELDKFYTTGMFSGTVKGYQLNVIDDPMAEVNNNLQNYMRYRIPNLMLYDGIFGVKRQILGTNPKDTIIPILTFIDEMEMDGDAVSLLRMGDVAYVKYIPGIVIGAGFNTSTGAIYIYTKKGNEKGPVLKGLPFVYIKGYNVQKEFAGPDYNDKSLLKKPDLRTTVYWNPNIVMDKTNNKVRIEYYNNDVSKKLLLKIEGINAVGKLIYIEKIIE